MLAHLVIECIHFSCVSILLRKLDANLKVRVLSAIVDERGEVMERRRTKEQQFRYDQRLKPSCQWYQKIYLFQNISSMMEERVWEC